MCSYETCGVQGENFGGSSSNATVLVGGLPCTGAQWRKDDSRPYITCTTPTDVVGPKNATIRVALQETIVSDVESLFVSKCYDGWYGQIGEWCVPCPDGSNCTGWYAEPYPRSGLKCPSCNLTYMEPFAHDGWWGTHLEPKGAVWKAVRWCVWLWNE